MGGGPEENEKGEKKKSGQREELQEKRENKRGKKKKEKEEKKKVSRAGLGRVRVVGEQRHGVWGPALPTPILPAGGTRRRRR